MNNHYHHFAPKKASAAAKKNILDAVFKRSSLLCLTLIAWSAGCAAWVGKTSGPKTHQNPASSGLGIEIEKQQIVIDDLSQRITELENIILKQEYELKKIKKIVKKHNSQTVDIVSSDIESGQAEEEYEAENYGFTDYEILMDESDDQGADDKRPLLKIHGSPKTAAYSTSTEKAADVATLMQEAALAANFVPLKLNTVTLDDAGDIEDQADTELQPDEEKEEGPKTVDPYEAGMIKYKEGKWLDASLYFDIFLKKNNGSPKTANALFLKAESLYQAGKTIEALGTFELVVEKFPAFSRTPEAKFRIGRCYEKLSDKEKAVKLYESVVQNHPKSPAAGKASKRLKEIKK